MERSKLIEILAELKIPIKLVKLIQITLRDSRVTVQIQNDFSDNFNNINLGVLQGAAL